MMPDPKITYVTRPELAAQGDLSSLLFTVRMADAPPATVRFSSQQLSQTDAANAALAASVLPAMTRGLPLHVEGSISPALLQGIETIQQIFSAWDDGFRRIPITTSGVAEPQLNGRGVASFFAGGLDAFYTLLKHLDEIDTIIHIYGFDYAAQFAGREAVATHLRSVAAELRKTLIEVETDVREFADPYVRWGLYHGALLASVALLLAGRFRKIYVPASHTYRCLVPCGSHPLTDPLWSTERLDIVHDGCEATRVKKAEAIARHPVAMNYLRVCWESYTGAGNCGKCEKCLRTMINLAAVGALSRCQAFSRPLELWRVARIKVEHEGIRDLVLENLEAVQKSRVDPGLAAALEDCLDGVYAKGILGWPRRAMNFLRRRGRWKSLN